MSKRTISILAVGLAPFTCFLSLFLLLLLKKQEKLAGAGHTKSNHMENISATIPKKEGWDWKNGIRIGVGIALIPFTFGFSLILLYPEISSFLKDQKIRWQRISKGLCPECGGKLETSEDGPFRKKQERDEYVVIGGKQPNGRRLRAMFLVEYEVTYTIIKEQCESCGAVFENEKFQNEKELNRTHICNS